MRHSNAYSIEGNYRERVSKWIAVFSVVGFLMIYQIIISNASRYVADYFFGSPAILAVFSLAFSAFSATLIYFILWNLFDKYIWKASVLRRWHHLDDFSGIWVGVGHTSFNDTRYKFKLSVQQTFTRMSCDVETVNSRSGAILMGVIRDHAMSKERRLHMAYVNGVWSDDAKWNKTWPDSHLGFCSYRLEEEKLFGDYFTNSSPQTRGTIELKRIDPCLEDKWLDLIEP